MGREHAGYRIESVLRRGGTSVVYVAEDMRHGRTVALEILAPELAAEPGFRDRFVREAELAASLDHPNIVPVYEAGESDGQLWIADRFSGNGTIVRRPDDGALRCEPGRRYLVPRGSLVELAEQSFTVA